MKIRKGLLCSVLLVAGLVFVGFSPQSYAAKQKKNLVDDSALGCTGTTVGKVIVAKKGSDVLVKVKITNGTLIQDVWSSGCARVDLVIQGVVL
jgi:hypothetical protein